MTWCSATIAAVQESDLTPEKILSKVPIFSSLAEDELAFV
jgi:hypothetical protein